MNIALANFQLNTIKKLLECMENDTVHNIILKSPTGSGKTIILTHFIDEYLKSHSNTIFIWLTPGKGNLEEQSKDKMDKYIHNSQTKLLADVMINGFEENDCCFINWEKLTKKGNNALKDSERTNFSEWIEKAFNQGYVFKVIIDESHTNFTDKADAIIQLFKTDKIIRCSATPISDKQAKCIDVAEEDVISEGLIKKMLVINENFPQEIKTNSQTDYLLEHALKKQRELRQLYLSKNVDVNPLILVQLPNNSDTLLETIEKYFGNKGINYENDLAVWLSNRHENLENIEKNNSNQVAVIIKQAIATGWDCPRASILVKLRENMDETFEIQTIGRIRRMPEAKHYDNDVLDNCYLYTFDRKFIEDTKTALGNGAFEAKTLFIKNEYKKVKFVKEQRTMITNLRNPRKALNAIKFYMQQEFELTRNKEQNKVKLQALGFKFLEEIVRYTISGNVIKLSELSNKDGFNIIYVKEPINTTIHGRECHNVISRIGLEIGLEYSYMRTIIGQLFAEKFEYREKILSLTTRQLYAFVINNFLKLKEIVKNAMAKELKQLGISFHNTSKKDFFIPRSCMFTYDGQSKVQDECKKNVYQGYLLSAEPRSSPEKKFEKFCENCDAIEWFYKNGDKGDEYLSILYLDNSNRQKLFYPDYIISANDEIWVIETKGGFNKAGKSEDIDKFSAKKFKELKRYLGDYNLKGGFVRYDSQSDELFICTEKYNDNIHSTDWEIIKNVIKR